RKLGLAITRDITDTGDVFTIENISIPSATINSGSKFTKGAMTIELLGKVDLTGITASGKVTRVKEGDNYKITSKEITDLIITDITATSIHVTVEGKPADPAKGTKESPPIDVVVPNANIKGLHVWGFDLLTMKGSFETTSANVTDVAVEIGKKGEAAFKEIGLTVKGTGLAGTLMGPDRVFLDLGNMEISGSYKGGGVDIKKFSLVGIGGFVDIGTDYVRVFTLNTGALNIGPVVYRDKDGNQLDIATIDCPAVHLEDLYAKWTKDPTTKEEKFSELTFSGLVFDKVVASGFKYTGKFTSENDKKQKVESELELKATTATLEPLAIENFTYDALKELVNVEPSFGKLDIPNFQAKFSQYVDAKLMHKLKLVTDVTGERMKANLNFEKITSATGDAWKFSHGTFHIDEFGLKHPDIEYSGRDEKGALKEWEVKKLPGTYDSAIDLTGLDVTVMKDGAMFVDFDALTAKSLRIKQIGGPTIDVSLAALKTAAIAIQNQTPDKAFEILGATFDELELKGIKVTLEVDRSAPGTPGAASSLWILDPLKSLDGTLNVTAHDTPVGVVDIPVQIRSSEIDFDDLTGDDGYFLPGDIWFFIDKHNIWVRHFKIPKTLYNSKDDIPGVTPADIEFVTSGMDPNGMPIETEIIRTRGQLNLKEFLEGTLNKKSTGTSKPAEQLEDLNNLTLKGTLDVGDGVMGKTENNVTLSGRSRGKNQIGLS
ncbi:MAG: hypothetical protein ACRD6N_13715, partial [Pyrinomonadaceae bacterium]